MKTPLQVGLFLALACCLSPAVASEQVGTTPDSNPPASAAELAPDPARRAQVLGTLPSGILLVPESTNRRVLALDPGTGDVLDPNFIPADSVNLQTPIQAKLSPDRTRVLISDQIRDVIQAFSIATGAFIETFAPAGGANNAIADNIRGWEFTPTGNALVTVGAGANNNAIAQFSPTGVPLANFIAPSVGGIASPFDIYRMPAASAPIAAGDYLVSNATNGQVNRFSSTGAPVALFATAGTFAQQILRARNGNILVAAFSPPAAEGVYEFSPTGTQVARLDNATTSGYRGVWELANGNILTTTGTGIHELDRTSGALVRTVVSGISARYIDFVQVQQDADLVLTGTVGSAQVQQPFNVNLTLTNAGPGNANNARVIVNLPMGMSYIADTCATVAITGGRRWNAGNLAAGAQANCTLTLRVELAGRFEIAASASSDTNDPIPSNNSAILGVAVAAQPVPSLTVDRLLVLVLVLLLVGIAALRLRP